MFKQLLIQCTVLIITCLSSPGILDINTTNFKAAKEQFKYLLVYYYDVNCRECANFTDVYRTLWTISRPTDHNNTQTQQPDSDVDPPSTPPSSNPFTLPQQVQFAQLQFNQLNEQLFRNENIEAVPEILLYSSNGRFVFKYPFIDVKAAYENVGRIAVWVRRCVQGDMPLYQDMEGLGKEELFEDGWIEEDGKYVIIKQNNQHMAHKLKSTQEFLQFSDISFVKVKNIKLDNNQILLKQGDYQTKIKCFYNETEINKSPATADQQNPQISGLQACKNKISNFRYRGIVHLSDQIIHQLYNNNRSVLVVVTSNESNSFKYVRKLKAIKQKIDDDIDQIDSVMPIFAVADVYYNLESSIRMKKFIGGYQLKGWPYPFPLLAYLYQNQEGIVKKYIYQMKYQNSRKQDLSIQQWFNKAIKHQLVNDLRGYNITPQLEYIQNIKQRSIYKIYLSQLVAIVQKYTKQTQTIKIPKIYLYVLWKGSWPMQATLLRIKKWWETKNATTLFYTMDLTQNQLPDYLVVNNLPAFAVFYSDGSMDVIEGVEDQNSVFERIGLEQGGTG